MADYTARRTTMVDTQIRPSDVTKFPVIEAMLTVPREIYVPDAKQDAAYVGEHVELGNGRVVMDPRVLAKMLDAVNVQNDEMVLDIGCALGYSTALISRMAEAVVAVEEDENMASEAEAQLAEQGVVNAVVHAGPLADGAAKHGPYDVIILQGAVAHLPDAVVDQLKEGGRICCLFMKSSLGTVRVGHKIDGAMNWRYAFNAGAPILPGFEKHTAFTL